jgi:hypothetical protein
MLSIGKPEPARSNISEKHGTERVFKARMVGSRIHQIRKTELFYVAEALEYRRIEQGKCKILHLDVAMNRVFYYLHGFTKESSYTSHKSIE